MWLSTKSFSNIQAHNNISDTKTMIENESSFIQGQVVRRPLGHNSKQFDS